MSGLIKSEDRFYRNKYFIILIFFLIIFSILISYNFFYQKFDVVNPQIATVVDSVYGLGSIKSHKVFHARVALTTLMEKMYVKEGQWVSKGTPLFRLSEGAIIYAPFDGEVSHVAVQNSEMVYAQKDILIMQDLKELYVEVNLEQQGAVKIKKNMKAILSFDNLSNRVIDGLVTAILPYEDKFIIQVSSEKLPDGLLPAMSVDVTFTIAIKENAVLLPMKTVINGHVVKFNKDKTQERIKVVTGIQDGNYVEILSPKFNPDDQIIINKK